MTPLRISAKNLGSFALTNTCDRCNWLKLKTAFKLPYEFFPGIFSSIDSYTKKVVDGHFNQNGTTPAWLTDIGEIETSLTPPHYSKFNTLLPEYDILLTGNADALYRMRDGSLCFADYKTAKFTQAQDELLPLYNVQLNCYALIAEQIGLGRVSGLALVYFEPETASEHAWHASNSRERGFALGFSAHVLSVELDPARWVMPYLRKARELYNRSSAPVGHENCDHCERLSGLLSLITG